MLCLLCSIHRSAFTSFTTTTHSACPSHFGPASTVACASIILFFSLARHPLWLTFQLSRPVVEARAPEYPENNTVQHLALAALTCQYHQRALVSQGSLPRSAGSSYLTPWSVERALLFTQYQHYPLSSITFTSVTPFPICCRRQSCSLASCILHPVLRPRIFRSAAANLDEPRPNSSQTTSYHTDTSSIRLLLVPFSPNLNAPIISPKALPKSFFNRFADSAVHLWPVDVPRAQRGRSAV